MRLKFRKVPRMSKYKIFTRILDALSSKAANTKWAAKYAVDSTDAEKIAQARSRAFIHLYIKVMFGITDFVEREQHITDGPYDGGIDGYFVDSDTKRIYLLQSKFRATEKNFESSIIRPEEILVMDIDRITCGEKLDLDGNEYNGKILGLERRISEIPDIARYSYQVAILANCDLRQESIRRLTGGYNAEVFNFQRSYNELVFPIVSGTYFRATDLTINLDLNHKSAGAKTSYSVSTPNYDCEITVLFVPTIEIARTIDRYRNSILEYNPRSYLDFEGQQVNVSIRETLLRPDTNEFALMNNGLTILSDETNLNERIGQQNKAQLRLLNPQIINGGQTAYTLGRIFRENLAEAPGRFSGKEVLVKVITLTPRDNSVDNAQERRRLIDEISEATNRQTVVTSADRLSNESMHIQVQKKLFDQFGLLYERKRGEFSDGILAKYIRKDDILDRNLFVRVFLAANGDLQGAIKKRPFIKSGITDQQLLDTAALERFFEGYMLFRAIVPSISRNDQRYSEALIKLFLGMALPSSGDRRMRDIETHWDALVVWIAARRNNFVRGFVDTVTRERRMVFDTDRWIKSGTKLDDDVKSFVNQVRLSTS